jgi:hypothetical protein
LTHRDYAKIISDFRSNASVMLPRNYSVTKEKTRLARLTKRFIERADTRDTDYFIWMRVARLWAAHVQIWQAEPSRTISRRGAHETVCDRTAWCLDARNRKTGGPSFVGSHRLGSKLIGGQTSRCQGDNRQGAISALPRRR